MDKILVSNWRAAPRMLSMQLAAMAVVFGALPQDTQAAVLGLVGVPASRVPAILGALFMLGRMVQQGTVAPSVAATDDKPPA